MATNIYVHWTTFIHVVKSSHIINFHLCDKFHIIEYSYLCKIPSTWTIAQFIYGIIFTHEHKSICHQVFSR